MKKIKFIAIPFAAALCLGGVACNAKADEAPEITGIVDKMCAVGEIYDLLDGVAALDKEDGDITPKLRITIDGKEIDGYYTEFDEEDDYEVKYKVTDSKGNVTEETATISALARDEYKRFELVNLDGFEVKTAGEAKCSQSVVGDGDRSLFTLKTSGAQAPEDVVLSREYTLKSGKEYTFKYYLKSNVAGAAKAKVGGETFDLDVTDGNNTLSFTYSVPADAANTEIKEEIQILLGGLGDAQIDFDKAEAGHEDALGGEINLKVGSNVYERFDGTQGEVSASQDGKSATLKVTSAHASDMWRGGMFINTGLKLSADTTYTVSFDVTAMQDELFDVVIQNKQWDESAYETVTIRSEEDYHQEITFTPNANVVDGLWLYVRSGAYENEITLSNLTVSSEEVQVVTETFTCGNVFKMFAKNGAPNYVQWIDGKLVFEVEKFGDTDWHNKIEGPQFFVDTSGVEFMISFRAKATAPVLCTWVGPKSGGWDPNLIWRQFNLSETETIYTFKGNESDMSNHQFEWQFGFSANQKYENVKIEISDIVIYWQNGILDN